MPRHDPFGDTVVETPHNNRRFLFIVTGVIILIIAVAVAAFFLMPAMDNSGISGSKNPGNPADETETITVPFVPLFKIINGTNETFIYDYEPPWGQDNPVPPINESQFYATKALEPFGGIPADAQVESIEDLESSCHGYNCSVTKRAVRFRQTPYGMPVFGRDGRMSVNLYAVGEPGGIYKLWLPLDEVGIIRVISASEAVERLRDGEVKNSLPDVLNLTVHNMKLGYYTPENYTVLPYLEPIWVIDTTDEITNWSMIFYVPAEMRPDQHELYDNMPPGTIRNFSQQIGNVPRPDISSASNILIGTSGPVGEDKARESIEKFTGKSIPSLSYNGRFKEFNSCGQEYYWIYYGFTSPGCEFKVETYTGSVISAAMNRSCANIGITGLSDTMKNSPEDANALVRTFVRNRYYNFDLHHMQVSYGEMPSRYIPNIHYYLEGDSTNIDLSFFPDSGMLNNYAVYNSDQMTHCGGNPVRIGD